MSHRVGALDIPAPVPAHAASVGDPGLDILGDFFRTVLTFGLASAWSAVAPREDVVKKLKLHNPEDFDFIERDLPALYVWRQRDQKPTRIADGYQQSETPLHILWAPPLVPQERAQPRDGLLSAFDKMLNLVVQLERHPSWIHASQTALPEAQAYGSDVLALAGLDHWQLQSIDRTTIDVPTGDKLARYAGYLATLVIQESTDIDQTNAAWGIYPSRVKLDVTTGGATPLVTQSAEVPLPDP